MIKVKKLVKESIQKNEKILVWCTFINSIKKLESELREWLESNGNAPAIRIWGEVPTDSEKNDEWNREDEIEKFKHSSEHNVLIANPASLSESISLHKTCFNAIYYDLSYNCAQFLQSIDRIHRVGGSETEESHYYFLQYKDSIDSDILTLLYNRRDRMYDLIEKDYSIYSMDMFEEDHEDLNAYERIFTKQ